MNKGENEKSRNRKLIKKDGTSVELKHGILENVKMLG